MNNYEKNRKGCASLREVKSTSINLAHLFHYFLLKLYNQISANKKHVSTSREVTSAYLNLALPLHNLIFDLNLYALYYNLIVLFLALIYTFNLHDLDLGDMYYPQLCCHLSFNFWKTSGLMKHIRFISIEFIFKCMMHPSRKPKLSY